jgi:hypothetical protein
MDTNVTDKTWNPPMAMEKSSLPLQHAFPDFINSCHRKIKYHPLANYLPWWWLEK